MFLLISLSRLVDCCYTFLVGDIFDYQIFDKNTIQFLEGITTKYPTYYVTGNHEYCSGRVEEMRQMSFHVEALEG